MFPESHGRGEVKGSIKLAPPSFEGVGAALTMRLSRQGWGQPELSSAVCPLGGYPTNNNIMMSDANEGSPHPGPVLSTFPRFHSHTPSVWDLETF